MIFGCTGWCVVVTVEGVSCDSGGVGCDSGGCGL